MVCRIESPLVCVHTRKTKRASNGPSGKANPKASSDASRAKMRVICQLPKPRPTREANSAWDPFSRKVLSMARV